MDSTCSADHEVTEVTGRLQGILAGDLLMAARAPPQTGIPGLPPESAQHQRIVDLAPQSVCSQLD